MQGEFEKQVQQKMEELKITPSEPVWQKIEDGIRKKKERRRFFFLLLLAGLLTAGISWWGLSNSSKNNSQTSQSIQPVNKTTSENVHRQKTTDTTQAKINSPTITNKKSFGKKTNDNLLLQETAKNYEIAVAEKNKKRVDSHSSFKQNKTDQRQILPCDINEKDQKQVETMPLIKQSQVLQNSTKKINQTVPEEQIKSVKDSIANTEIKQDALQQPQLADSLLKKKIVSNKKLQKFITVEAGWSQYNQGVFSADKSVSNSYTAPSSISGSLNLPHSTTPGFSFVIGAGVRKKISERVDADASVQFHYYSTHIKVGADTMNGPARVYVNTDQNNYTNKFGVVEIPVNFNYRLSSSLPIYFSLGAAYGHLLKSNALTFDYNYNLYYNDQNNLVKNYLNFSSSLQYQVISKSKFKIQTGPSIQYNASKIFVSNPYSTPHLFFAGLKAQIIF